MNECNMNLKKYLPSVIPFAFPGVTGVSCFFTTALYGNISLDADLAGSEDAKRRAALPALLGFESWTELHQVHGDVVLENPEPTFFERPSCLDADGACTSKPGQAMLSKAADCQQIMLAHTSGKYVAALHCGWKGNSIDFPVSGVRSFCRAFDLHPRDVLAVRGPSLGPGAAEFVNFEQEWPQKFNPWFNRQTRYMDLWSLTRHQLQEAGVPSANIFSIDLCTYAVSDLLFSFRRGHSGRQGAIIFINS